MAGYDSLEIRFGCVFTWASNLSFFSYILCSPSGGGGGGGGAPKSWASLFQKDTPANLSGGTQNKPTARIQPYTNVGDEGIEGKSDSKRNKDEGKPRKM